jgi:hypothetical protein
MHVAQGKHDLGCHHRVQGCIPFSSLVGGRRIFDRTFGEGFENELPLPPASWLLLKSGTLPSLGSFPVRYEKQACWLKRLSYHRSGGTREGFKCHVLAT